MYSKEHNLGVVTAYCGEGGSNAGFFSLYGKPPAPGRLFAWPGVPISPGQALYGGYLEAPIRRLLRTPSWRPASGWLRAWKRPEPESPEPMREAGEPSTGSLATYRRLCPPHRG